MPSKKKKYNSRFPPARIKKIMQSDEEVGKVAQVTSILSSEEFKFLREIANTVPDVNPGTEAEDEEGSVATPTTAGPQTAFQRRTSSAGTSGHQLSAAGQSAAVGFRTRGRPRKRPIVESQSSLRSMTSHEEPEESEETEEDDDEDDGDEEEEVQQSSNSDNNRINSNSQITNNNNHNNSNNFSVINSNYYNSSLQTTNPSPYVSTIQSIASSSAAVLKPNPPKVEEDDDYDN